MVTWGLPDKLESISDMPKLQLIQHNATGVERTM